MKQITEYICEICNTKYSLKSECLNCEKSHRIPVRIEMGQWRYQPYKNNRSGYPDRVDIYFDDGKTITYARG